MSCGARPTKCRAHTSSFWRRCHFKKDGSEEYGCVHLSWCSSDIYLSKHGYLCLIKSSLLPRVMFLLLNACTCSTKLCPRVCYPNWSAPLPQIRNNEMQLQTSSNLQDLWCTAKPCPDHNWAIKKGKQNLLRFITATDCLQDYLWDPRPSHSP